MIEITLYLIHATISPLIGLFVPLYVGLVLVMLIVVIAIQVFLFK